jgi:acyl carrier protein phosphodiesterase
MNYLAHLSLSFKNDDLMLGNLVADFTRKAKFGDFSSEVQRGIKLHHFIDDFTDSHSLVDAAKALIRPQQGKFSGVVMDIYFDHLLARDYHFWHEESLADFAQNAYRLFNCRKEELPETTLGMLHYMEKGNWLYNYASHNGLSQSLEGMSRRTAYNNSMHLAAMQLQELEVDIKPLFESFYPELIYAASQWLERFVNKD